MAMNPAAAIEEERGPHGTRPALGHTLPVGTRLRDYEITGLIGEGGFGIVYLAWDHSLQRKVAVKEYMPASMVSRLAGSSAIVVKSDRHLDTFKAGLKSFVNEARLLARFDHPSLVKVYRFWEENGTAYMVMPFYEGPTLKTALAELGHVPGETELRAWLRPILNAVTVLHDGETWHQNIDPDAVMLTPIGPVLLGFGSAAHTIAALNHTPAAALKPGFAAIEQYGGIAETTRGPWTDLYALAAVIYAAITGEDPVPAADRLADDRLAPLTSIAAGLYSDRFLAAIDAALAVQPERRPRDHLQFRALMGDIETPERLELAPPLDLMQEPFAGAVEGNREVTVPDGPLVGAPTTATPAVTAAAAKGRAKPTPRATSAEVAAAHVRPRHAVVDAGRPTKCGFRKTRRIWPRRRDLRADRRRRAGPQLLRQEDATGDADRRVAGRDHGRDVVGRGCHGPAAASRRASRVAHADHCRRADRDPDHGAAGSDACRVAARRRADAHAGRRTRTGRRARNAHHGGDACANDSRRAPGTLPRHPAKSVARADQRWRDRLLQEGMQMKPRTTWAHRFGSLASLVVGGALALAGCIPPVRRHSRRQPPRRPTIWLRRRASCRRSWPGSSRRCARRMRAGPSAASCSIRCST